MTDRTPWVDRFDCKLVLVLLDNKRGPSIKAGRCLWGLHDPLTYRPSNQPETLITAPRGFPTDLASIPRWGWVLLPPDGPWVKAAVIHDFLYTTGGRGVWKHQPIGITREPYSRKEADWILRDAMENRGVDRLRRWVIWAAVRLGGRRGWDEGETARPMTEADERFVTE